MGPSKSACALANSPTAVRVDPLFPNTLYLTLQRPDWVLLPLKSGEKAVVAFGNSQAKAPVP